MKRRCPTCKKTVTLSFKEQSEEAKCFPFCSQRCKLIDFGAWLDDKYKIVTKPSDIPTGAPPASGE